MNEVQTGIVLASVIITADLLTGLVIVWQMIRLERALDEVRKSDDSRG